MCALWQATIASLPEVAHLPALTCRHVAAGAAAGMGWDAPERQKPPRAGQ